MRNDDSVVFGIILGFVIGMFLAITIIAPVIDVKSENPITHTALEIEVKNGVRDTTYILER